METPARRAAKKKYGEFEMYIRRQGITNLRLATQLKAFLGNQMAQGYKMTTIRTGFGHIVGEHQRVHDEKLSSVEVKDLGKWLEGQTRVSVKSKAKPITAAELPQVEKKIKASMIEELILETLVRTCSRAGNLASMVHIGLRGAKWSVLFKQHKTRHRNVLGNVEMDSSHFSAKLQQYIALLKEGDYMFTAKQILAVTKKLQKAGVKLHSFRRGGILELYRQGVPFERIRSLTKHTTDGQMLEYLDVKEVS